MTERLTDMLKLRGAYRAVFDKESEAGQRVLRHLMKVGFISKCPFVAGDPHQTSLNIGAQRLVQSILRFIYASDDQIRLAIQQTHENESP